MWSQLPETQREEYKKMILVFCGLTKLFSQKSQIEDDDNDDHIVPVLPIINSKYQETIFQKVFNATAEDIHNTSFDVSLKLKHDDNHEHKYIVGIKTFGFSGNAQKVAQFKSHRDSWGNLFEQIQQNSSYQSIKEINRINAPLYNELARQIAIVRNRKIDSHIANLQGFSVDENDKVTTIYHVLMPMLDGNDPYVVVGETTYDKIDIENITIEGCSKKSNPTNFTFRDNNHRYRFSSADCQLYMYFNNSSIELERWNVQYINDVYNVFSRLANELNTESPNDIIESHSWKINVQPYSGFNSFYALGSKQGPENRAKKISKYINNYRDIFSEDVDTLEDYLNDFNNNDLDKNFRNNCRQKAISFVHKKENEELLQELYEIVYERECELYIPIPKSKSFHENHPNFFCEGTGILTQNEKGKWHCKENSFILVCEPSGIEIECHIVQDSGKGIQSIEHQDILGEWIIRNVFQLEEHEPLTYERLEELGINGIRLDKMNDGKIHLRFIYNDDSSIKPGEFID